MTLATLASTRVAPRPARRSRRRALVALSSAAALAVALAGCISGTTPSPEPTPSPSPLATTGADGCPTVEPPALGAGEVRDVTIQTSLGAIVIRVNADLSPIAAGNFVALAECGYYDGVVFHRVVPGFVIQGGDPTGTGMGGPGYTIRDEPVSTAYHRGTVAMARTQQPNSQGSQFFIVLADEAQASLVRANTYAIFGEVTSGMEAVDAIAAAADAELPTNPIVMDAVTVTTP